MMVTTMMMTKIVKLAMKIMSCFDVKHGDVTKLWSRHDKHGKEPHRGGDDNADDIGDDMRDDGDMSEDARCCSSSSWHSTARRCSFIKQ